MREVPRPGLRSTEEHSSSSGFLSSTSRARALASALFTAAFFASSQTLQSVPEVVKSCKELQGLLEFLS